MRHVIVMGGTRGLGLALVKALLDCGYRVSACGTKSRWNCKRSPRAQAISSYPTRRVHNETGSRPILPGDVGMGWPG